MKFLFVPVVVIAVATGCSSSGSTTSNLTCATNGPAGDCACTTGDALAGNTPLDSCGPQESSSLCCSAPGLCTCTSLHSGLSTNGVCLAQYLLSPADMAVDSCTAPAGGQLLRELRSQSTLRSPVHLRNELVRKRSADGRRHVARGAGLHLDQLSPRSASLRNRHGRRFMRDGLDKCRFGQLLQLRRLWQQQLGRQRQQLCGRGPGLSCEQHLLRAIQPFRKRHQHSDLRAYRRRQHRDALLQSGRPILYLRLDYPRGGLPRRARPGLLALAWREPSADLGRCRHAPRSRVRWFRWGCCEPGRRVESSDATRSWLPSSRSGPGSARRASARAPSSSATSTGACPHRTTRVSLPIRDRSRDRTPAPSRRAMQCPVAPATARRRSPPARASRASATRRPAPAPPPGCPASATTTASAPAASASRRRATTTGRAARRARERARPMALAASSRRAP